ncbi:hypothetical protein K7I13_05840 [Brucepastera parasyntrophica]|uniref:hypothetical protein n=1 Tax=Brucepastera parasyntrophica TaxID=2880008 RepID=UPI00210B3817|nr:hypothetical protein [Brucepastera parasyntrophica]ULQ60789.1 hypothetical protein K7I13_05840 [Brucepastera parasyntrophica]
MIFAFPKLNLDFGYDGTASEIKASLKFDAVSIKTYPEDILEELTIRLFAGNFIIEGGKMKIVWGKGDKLHVIDSFNANDYTDFIFPEYIDRRIAEPMFRVVWNAPFGMKAEAVYTPFMTADRSASSGIWMPSAVTELAGTAAEVLGAQAAAALASGDAAAIASIQAKADTIIPETASFDYGQAGLRLTHTFGPVDMGVSWYAGHYKQPTADLSGYLTAKAMEAAGVPDALAADSALPALHYDSLQIFGIEAAAAAGRFNLRGEAAYYLTRDIKGEDPWVRNSSINWVAGFDVDLPVHNFNINIQNQGMYILHNDKIGSGVIPPGYDTDYRSNGYYSSNRIAVVLKDSFLRDKLELSCNFIWGIEGREFLVQPKISFNAADGLFLTLQGIYVNTNKDGEFYDYRNNSFIQAGLTYKF